MGKIKLNILPPPWERNGFYDGDAPPPERRPVYEVLNAVDEGASRRGSTFYKTLFTCPREFGLAYVLGLRPLVPAEALTVGWLFHLALEVYYKALQDWQSTLDVPKNPYAPSTRIKWEHYWWGGASKAMQQGMAAIDPLMSEPGYRETWRILEKVTGHYFDKHWKVDRWRILAVEETLECAWGEAEEFEYSARLDILVQDFSELLKGMYIVEQKTARALTADLVANYQQDLQILGQNWLVKNVLDLKALPPLQGTFVDIVTKQENTKSDRVVANPSARHLYAFQESIESWSRLRNYMEGEGWPRSLGKCAGAARGYSKCQFYDLCHDHPDMGVEDWQKSPDAPFGYTRKEMP